MRRILTSLAAAAILSVTALPASAHPWNHRHPVYGVPPAGRFPVMQRLLQAAGGLNVNIIRNSANGVGNSIFTNNRGGGINVNVIEGSANGANNTIGIGNRR